jgi:hypothetical protein
MTYKDSGLGSRSDGKSNRYFTAYRKMKMKSMGVAKHPMPPDMCDPRARYSSNPASASTNSALEPARRSGFPKMNKPGIATGLGFL